MQLFYDPNIEAHNSEIVFSKTESRHIRKVLRKPPGSSIYLTNGKGNLFEALLEYENNNNCKAKIIRQEYDAGPKFKLHMVVAPTKNNDRFEWFLEKATEIGVSEITPIQCHHSERKLIKLDRYKKILVSALKQSNRLHLPVLNPMIDFEEFLKTDPSGNCYIAHCENGNKPLLQNSIEKNTDTTILIGPEGDFSSVEIKRALHKGFRAISLGNTRLRTETAALVACHTVQLLNN
jgi:16S rRNA (uracil1498-N3)-methyltransferase